ncbi:TonB-dependent receptor family protein [Pseudomonas poae]|uniref:TonB-dependent receptor n=1 Tax=Pseudomonas poae TaxID=200451 RepID=A0A2S9EJA8_9PSED|nr:TonB-dependent receptor [Pseudomonas poae]PRA26181.1 TonB-dependent receptor [Pseudomonas poae]PRC15346.1 TonB-dependent receptor [Pseudomonas poae]
MQYLSGFKQTGLAISISATLLISTHAAAQTNDSVLDTVVVQGQNETVDTFVGDAKKEKAPESKATLSKAQLQKFVGLDSAVTGALKYLPGVHSSGGDSSGITEGSLNIRGFSQDQLGVTRDGIPLNDPQFLTPHADFLGDPENYESVSVLYGSSSINAPTLTASGGSIEIKSVAPTKESGVLYKQTVGSDNLYRSFVRVNTGEYKGFSAWLSASRTTGDLWDDSDGELSSNRYEGNLQYKWGDGNQINALFSSFLMRTNSYLSPTLAQYRANDYDHGYPTRAYPTLGGTNGVADITAPGVNAANSRADFKIQTYGLNGLFNLSDGVQLKVNPYFIRVTDGTASIATAAVNENTLGTDVNRDGDAIDPVVPASLQLLPTQYRIGSSNSLDLTLADNNVLQLGLWTDYTHARNQFIFTPIKGNGKPASIDGSDSIRDGRGNVVYNTNQANQITTQKLWVQDTWHLNSALALTTGLAWQHSELKGADRLTGYDNTEDYNRFLPSLSLSYQLDAQNQLYYNTTSNMRVPAIASVYGRINGGEKQKPELTWNQELGWRYSTDNTLVSAAVFYDKFKDRQAAYQQLTGVTSYFNAGNVTTKGLELAVNGKLPANFNYFSSFTLLSSTQDSDYSAGGLTANTQGNQLFDAPRRLLSAGVGYDNEAFYANFLGRYTGSYYGDLENSQKIGGYTVFDLNLGYRFKDLVSGLKETTVSLNANNLFDKQYLSGVKSGTINADPSNPNFYGAPQYYKGQPRSLVASLTVGF